VSIIGKKENGGMCSEAAKGTQTEEAGMPCKGKSAGRRKKVENKGRRSGTCGQATRSAARKRRGIKEKSNARPIMESTGTLWERYSR